MSIRPTRPLSAASTPTARLPSRPRSAPAAPAPAASPQDCAARLVALVPEWMRELRTEMRAGASPVLSSVPAFRVLLFANRYPGGSLSDLAAHHGVTLPTASVSVERLVAQGLLESRAVSGDRRRRALHLTPEGRHLVASAMGHTTDVFAARLQALEAHELAQVRHALDLLDRALCRPPPAHADTAAPPAGA